MTKIFGKSIIKNGDTDHGAKEGQNVSKRHIHLAEKLFLELELVRMMVEEKERN